MAYADVNTHTNDTGSATSNPISQVIAGGFGNSTTLPVGLWGDPVDSLMGGVGTGAQQATVQASGSTWVWIAAAVAVVAIVFLKR